LLRELGDDHDVREPKVSPTLQTYPRPTLLLYRDPVVQQRAGSSRPEISGERVEATPELEHPTCVTTLSDSRSVKCEELRSVLKISSAEG
jgi:hypothetical protein